MLVLSRQFWLLAAICGIWVTAGAQQTSKVSLDNSETIFSVLTAMNACGYDQELAASDPMRIQVRTEVAHAIEGSKAAASAMQDLCTFYSDHQQDNAARDLAQYVSLALNLGTPPAFAPALAEADLPPDASYVLGLRPRLQRFYETASLHAIWQKHTSTYNGLIESWHQPIANMLLQTDVYLKLPISGYVGRKSVIYVEPMGAPGQVNARNYASDYYVVVSPLRGAFPMEPIRHTYLHFVLDPLAMKRAAALNRLKPLLPSVEAAPMDNSFKKDISLLVTESLIRAIESRTRVTGKGKEAEAARARAAQKSAAEGFILAPYFAERLAQFEKSEEGLQAAYPNWLYDIDVDRELKRARQVHFASQAVPEIVRASNPTQEQLLDHAERRLAAGDLHRAEELAHNALAENDSPHAGRALFILAQVAALNNNTSAAINYFQRALQVAREPRLIAWSHIYLARIFDINAERETAREHYRAALAAGDTSPATKVAAERGLQQPYTPPHPQPDRGPEKPQ